MSAFLCTPEHIQAIVSYGLFVKTPYCIPGDILAAELARQNLESVAYRYPDKTEKGSAKAFFPDDEEPKEDEDYIASCARPWMPGSSEFIPLRPAIEIIKLSDSLEYQSCEHPGWQESQGKKWINQIRDAAILRLEGWEAAPWTI